MPVSVRNYMFPIMFRYKGWMVTIKEDSSFFQFADLKVQVKIELDLSRYYEYAQIIAHTKAGLTSISSPHYGNENYAYNEYKKYESAVTDFFRDKRKTIEYTEKANGGSLDRFFGQNLSAVEKVQKKIQSYIDSNLGEADYKSELFKYLDSQNL